MNRLLRWLSVEARGKRVPLFVAAFLLLDFAYVVFAGFLYHVLGINTPMPESLPVESPIKSPAFIIASAAVIEEFVFRFLPLRFAVKRWGLSAKVLGVAAASSIVFGFLHGVFASLATGLVCIAIQGVAGFFYCLLFLKCGGFARHFGKATTAVVVGHAVYDAVAMYLVLALSLGF